MSRELNKDLTNLMEYLKKQDEDNKAILYAGRYIQKIILPVEEYQKMYHRLETIDNSKPSEALEYVENIQGEIEWAFEFNGRKIEEYEPRMFDIIKQALIKAQKIEKENVRYKQLEEQLGCPLEVVFRALINGVIYYQNDNGYLIEMKGIKLVKLCEWCLTNGNCYPMTKYYKSNWWLKEDKSE